jgi:hypothetical protein
VENSEALQSLFVICVLLGFVGSIRFFDIIIGFIYDKFFKNGK